LGPPSLPLARMVCQARSASRFSDTRVERGVASNNAFHLPFFDATAEYHRSDESSGPCADPGWAGCMRGAEHRAETGGGCASGYQGGTRGWDLMIRESNRGQARGSRPEEPDRSIPLLARRHRPRPGAVCHPHPCGRGGRSSIQHRAASPGWQASWVSRAPGASRRSHGGTGPEPSGAFCYGCLTGHWPQAANDGKGDRSQR
jgi:hypothetical protein